MQKVTFLAIFLINLAFNCQAQNELTYKIQFNPKTKYIQKVVQTSQNEVCYIGSDEFLESLKKRSLENPTILKTETIIESEIKTGKITNDTSFSVSLLMNTKTGNEKTDEMLKNLKILGNCRVGSLPKLDSIISSTFDEDFKISFLKTISATFSQINSKPQKVKVGESFTIEIPLTIPIAGKEMKMTSKTIYKLNEIKKNCGYFDVNIVFTMSSDMLENTFTAKGLGKGTLIYDISNNYMLEYNTDTEMDMFMKTENFDLELKSKSGFLQTVKIKKL
jgi:hypothetical protein